MISVLYVDDEPYLLEICKLFLERSKTIQVSTSLSAEEALEQLSLASYDAIISDYQMPGMDGIAFLKAVRKKDKKIPFIIFTGRGREEIVIEALKEGADFYLQKGGDPKSQFAELQNNIEQIVRQRTAEAELRSREILYRTLFEAAQDVIALMEQDRIIECNHRTEEMFAISQDQIIGKNPIDFSPDLQLDGNRSDEKANRLISLAMEGKPQFFEWRFVKTSGEAVDTEISLNRLLVDGKQLLLGIIRDISEHKRILGELEHKTIDLEVSYEELLSTEEELKSQYNAIIESETALRASEEKLRSILASMDDLVLTFDMKGVIRDAYKEHETEYFLAPEQFIDHQYTDVFPQKIATEFGSVFDRVIHSGKTDQFTYFIEVSGHIRYYHSKISIRKDKEGNPAGVTMVARDITEEKQVQLALKESKVELEAVIQGNPIPQFVIDTHHMVTHWNIALYVYSGISEKEVIGTNTHWRAFYPTERPCLSDLLIDQHLADIKKWYPGKCSPSTIISDAYDVVDFFPSMGDSGVWLQFTASLLRNDAGEIIGAVETLKDITKEKHPS